MRRLSLLMSQKRDKTISEDDGDESYDVEPEDEIDETDDDDGLVALAEELGLDADKLPLTMTVSVVIPEGQRKGRASRFEGGYLPARSTVRPTTRRPEHSQKSARRSSRARASCTSLSTAVAADTGPG